MTTVAARPIVSPLLLHDANGLPIHGVQARSWTVTHVDEARLVAKLEFNRPELLAAFPFPHRIEMEIAIVASTLTVAAALLPTAAEPVPVAFGFHPSARKRDCPAETNRPTTSARRPRV
jgi:aldose 1-epimerase